MTTTQSETIPHALQHVTHQAIDDLRIDTLPCLFGFWTRVFTEVTGFIFLRFSWTIIEIFLIAVKSGLLPGSMRFSQDPKNLASHHF